MITLLTGTPGAGKTAWTVQELTRLPSQRKIYIHGIPELKIAHEPIYCTSDLCDHCREKTHLVTVPAVDFEGQLTEEYLRYEEIDTPGVSALLVEEWQFWATEGSLIVIDEVQRVWRPTGTKVPDEIAALETHRHKGLDFWLISQGPHLFHSNVRLLIGRHIHLVSDWKGRNEYEFPECRQNVTSRGDAVVRPYKLPKKIFHLYKSASLHTVNKHRKPMSFYFLIATILIGSLLGVYTFQRFDKKFHPEKYQEMPVEVETNEKGQGVAQAATPVNTTLETDVKETSFPDFKPKIEGVLESAPAYAPLLKVTAVPLLYGCVYSAAKDICTCYTQQATPYPSTKNYCLETVKNHRFNPYFERVNSLPDLAINDVKPDDKQ